MAEIEERVLRVPTCRASIELQGRRPLTLAEEERFRAAIPDVGLAGAPFDDASNIYPFRVPEEPRVTVLRENPRRVSLRVLFKQGLYVGVIADHELEQAYLVHPGAFLYVVGTLQERQKGEKLFLDVYPRGWRVVEVGGDDGGASTEGKNRSRGRKNKKEKKAT